MHRARRRFAMRSSPRDRETCLLRSGVACFSGGFTASDADAKDAMRAAFRYLKIVAEPGGAIALAVALNRLPEALEG